MKEKRKRRENKEAVVWGIIVTMNVYGKNFEFDWEAFELSKALLSCSEHFYGP